jgi:hypothetical protein
VRTVVRSTKRLEKLTEAKTVLAEIFLKVLAHNISRLAARRRLAVVYVSLNVFSSTL